MVENLYRMNEKISQMAQLRINLLSSGFEPSLLSDQVSTLSVMPLSHGSHCQSFQVFFSVLMGAMNVGQAAPYVEAFASAKAAAAAIFAVIDRKPPIDSLSVSGP